MTATQIEQVPIDVGEDLTRAREVVAAARSDGRTAIVAHTRVLTVDALTRQIAAVEQQIETERREWGDWIHTAIETSRECAEENDWCPVYDDTMERLGLPRREPPMTDIGWRVNVTIVLDVDDDEVRDIIRSKAGRYSGVSIEVEQSATVSVEVRVEGETEGREGDCVCGSVDTEDINANLPSWVTDMEFEITDEGTVYCDND